MTNEVDPKVDLGLDELQLEAIINAEMDEANLGVDAVPGVIEALRRAHADDAGITALFSSFEKVWEIVDSGDRDRIIRVASKMDGNSGQAVLLAKKASDLFSGSAKVEIFDSFADGSEAQSVFLDSVTDDDPKVNLSPKLTIEWAKRVIAFGDKGRMISALVRFDDRAENILIGGIMMTEDENLMEQALMVSFVSDSGAKNLGEKIAETANVHTMTKLLGVRSIADLSFATAIAEKETENDILEILRLKVEDIGEKPQGVLVQRLINSGDETMLEKAKTSLIERLTAPVGRALQIALARVKISTAILEVVRTAGISEDGDEPDNGGEGEQTNGGGQGDDENKPSDKDEQG